MAKKKTANASADENGTTATELAPLPEAPAPEPPPPASDTNGTGERRPDKVFTYLIQRDTYVQVSVWERLVNMRNGGHFVAYDISLRKRYRQNGEWRSLYSWNASEVYALIHALNQATAWVTQMRAAEAECPF